MHPDPCSRAGLSRARYAGVARTRGAAKSQLGHRIRRRCEGERGTGGWSGKWRCRRSRGRLLGRHQWRVWRHGARGSAHEQPVSECVERRTTEGGFGFLIFRPVHSPNFRISGLKLYVASCVETLGHRLLCWDCMTSRLPTTRSLAPHVATSSP